MSYFIVGYGCANKHRFRYTVCVDINTHNTIFPILLPLPWRPQLQLYHTCITIIITPYLLPYHSIGSVVSPRPTYPLAYNSPSNNGDTVQKYESHWYLPLCCFHNFHFDCIEAWIHKKPNLFSQSLCNYRCDEMIYPHSPVT